MKTEGISSSDTPIPARSIRKVRHRRILFITIASVLAGLGGWAWRQHQAELALPNMVRSLPPLGDRPKLLLERLLQAQHEARSAPHFLEGVAELGRLYQENGYANEAVGCWEFLEKAQPAEPRWTYYLAELRRIQGDQTAAVDLFFRTVELEPNYAPAWLKLADLEFKVGSLKLAQSHYEKRLMLVPRDPYARLGLVRLAERRGEKEMVAVLLKQIVSETPGFSPAHNLYAEILSSQGDIKGARQQRWLGREAGRFRNAEDPWLTSLHAWCLDPKRLLILGTLEFQTGRGAEAVRYLERASELAPGDAAIYELLGSVYLKLGDAPRARERLERGVSVSTPGKPSAALFVNLSEAYRTMGQTNDALRATERGLAMAAGAFELHNAQGVVLSDLKRYDKAIAAYERALALSPSDPDTNFNLALSLLALGRKAEAKVALQRSLTQQPTFPKSLRALAGMALEEGQLAEAAKYLLPLYDANPGQADVQRLMAQWHLQSGQSASDKGDTVSAEREYIEGIDIDTTHPDLQANLGILYLLQGRYSEAVAPLESYHKLEIQNPQSALYLGQAYARVGRVADARKVLLEGEELARQIGSIETAGHCRQVREGL